MGFKLEAYGHQTGKPVNTQQQPVISGHVKWERHTQFPQSHIVLNRNGPASGATTAQKYEKSVAVRIRLNRASKRHFLIEQRPSLVGNNSEWTEYDTKTKLLGVGLNRS